MANTIKFENKMEVREKRKRERLNPKLKFILRIRENLRFILFLKFKKLIPFLIFQIYIDHNSWCIVIMDI